MSNIRSFDYRRKALGELQRELELQQIELRKQREWNDWQETYIDTLQIELNEYQHDTNYKLELLRTQLQMMQVMMMGLSLKENLDERE